MYRPCQRLGQLCCRASWLWFTAQLLGETAAVDKLQGEIRAALALADFIDLHDVRMLQTRLRLGFRTEADHLLGTGMSAGQDHLQRRRPLQDNMPCSVYDTHPAAAQLAQALVPGHGRRAPGLGSA